MCYNRMPLAPRVRVGWVRAIALGAACLASGLVPRVRAQSSPSPPVNVTGKAAVADGTDQRPYQVLVKDCYPFFTRASAVDASDRDSKPLYGGYGVEQLMSIHTDAEPFRVEYTTIDATFDEALQALKWGSR